MNNTVYRFLIMMCLVVTLSACQSQSFDSFPNEKAEQKRIDDAFSADTPGLYAAVIMPQKDQDSYAVSPTTQFSTKALRAQGGFAYQMGDYITIILPSDRLFFPGTDQVIEHGDALIKTTIPMIKKFPKHDVLVTAHTDGVGTKLFQAKLSYQQARVVLMKIWAAGALPNSALSHYHYAGMADTQPVAQGQSANRAALNRYVAITLYPRDKQALIEAHVQQAGFGEIKPITYEGF